LFSKRVIYPLIFPTFLILLSTFIVWKWPDLTKQVKNVKEVGALLQILPLLPALLFAIGIIMGWRFNNGGMILTSLLLGFSYLMLSDAGVRMPPKGLTGPGIPEALSFLLPLNIGFFATLTKRRLMTSLGLSCLILIICQVLALLLLCHPGNSSIFQWFLKLRGEFPKLSKTFFEVSTQLRPLLHDRSLVAFKHISTLPLFAFSATILFLFLRFLKFRDALSAGYLGTLIAIFLGMTPDHSGHSLVIYFSAAGLMLVATTIELSFYMAYIDELTELPGRRSLNETLINLGKKYTVAMADVDHFKKFNDKYGHKTGDQVLRMIASKLKGMNGGAKVFRYGGEEFTAIFPGKTVEEAVPHLEALRKTIESTPFIIRGKDRRKHTEAQRGKGGSNGRKALKVTVSIGLADSEKGLTGPEEVLKAADNILYRAKKAGRNRVET